MKVLQKIMAESGNFSRRQAEELIRNNKVYVNGKLAELGQRADGNDDVKVNGISLGQKQKSIYIMLNKPVGYVCTNRFFANEKNIFSLIKIKERLFAIGRLDKNSRGLLILTNDGALTQKISHPKFGHEKKYEVEVREKEKLNNPKDCEKIISMLKSGSRLEQGWARVKKVDYIGKGKFEIILTTGQKRQIREMLKNVGLTVVDLVRTEEAGLKLGNLPIGRWRNLTEKEIILLWRGARVVE